MNIEDKKPEFKKHNIPKKSKDKLKLWLSLHLDHPYPTKEEKKELATEAEMTMGQVRQPFVSLLTLVRSTIGL